jgi:rSAM/selenodomain-associated transferase 1
MKRALIVVAKRPAPGQTKTRLCPPLTPRQASELYRCFLLDTLDLVARVDGVQGLVAYLPLDAQDYFRAVAPPGFACVPQQGAHLGERLDRALRLVLAQGYEQVVVMNSDGPTLPLRFLEDAFRRLEDPRVDVVLGPSDDGGYYLIGLKRPCSALFDVTMSTPRVFEDTRARARESGLTLVCVPCWYDVDVAEDLERLAAELDAAPPDVAAHTRRFLATVRLSVSADEAQCPSE